jgi:hypothetical protein
MTVGSTAISRPQRMLADALGERSCPGFDCQATWPARKPAGDHAQFAHPARTRRRRRCVRPRIPGLSPGRSGASPSRPAVPSAGFPPASRLPAGFSPFARLPLVQRASVRSLRPLPGSGSPSVPSGFPFPWAISTLAPPRSDSAGVGPGRQGPRSSVLPRPLAGSRDPPAPQESSGWPPWDAATGSPTCVDSGGSGAFGEATQSGSSRASCSSQGNDAA